MNHNNETVSMVAGSYGYIAPEYGYTLKVDEKSDVYSFGVVILELLKGKMPLDPSFGDSVDIVEWVRRKANNIVSEQVLYPNVSSQCKYVQEEILLVLKIAALCTAKLPKDMTRIKTKVVLELNLSPIRPHSHNEMEIEISSN